MIKESTWDSSVDGFISSKKGWPTSYTFWTITETELTFSVNSVLLRPRDFISYLTVGCKRKLRENITLLLNDEILTLVHYGTGAKWDCALWSYWFRSACVWAISVSACVVKIVVWPYWRECTQCHMVTTLPMSEIWRAHAATLTTDMCPSFDGQLLSEQPETTLMTWHQLRDRSKYFI